MWYSACIKNTIYFFWPQKKCNLALQQKLIKKQYVVEFLMCVARKWKSSCSIEDEKGSIWNLKQPKMCSDFFDRTSHFFRLVLLKELFVCLLQTPSRVEIPTSIALGCGEKKWNFWLYLDPSENIMQLLSLKNVTTRTPFMLRSDSLANIFMSE